MTNLCPIDSQNRLTNLVWQAGGAGLASFGYKLMPGGTRTNALETVNAGPAVTCQWSFDGLYRLTNEIVSGIGNAAYQYDGVGNRLGRVGSLGPVNQSASYDTNDVWTAGSYGNPTPDKDFNTTSYNGNSYGYDSINRLTVLNGVGQSYAYDGDGNLLVKHLGGTNTFYLVDDRNPSGYAQVLEEYTETNGWGSAGWDLSRVYVYGLGLISEQEMDLNTLMPSTLSYYGYDGHGNVRFLMDTNGAITDTYTYDAFGNLIGSSGTTPNSYLYCGQRWDADLGLYYNRARYMNPDAGRFMTMDTYEGDQEDPLSLHKYLYAQDNPVMMVDPSGNDGDLVSLEVSTEIGAGLDALGAEATVTAEASAEGTVFGAEATEVTGTAVAEGETAAAAEETVAKTTLRMLGKTVRGIIEQAKKIMNLAKDSPEKVVPMPRSVIPNVCANITKGMLLGQPFELRRVNAEQTAINREKAVGLLPPAGPGKSWDEYPFASGKDPEFAPLPATVAPVPWWENSVQGGIIAGCYKIEDIKVGMPYTVIVIP